MNEWLEGPGSRDLEGGDRVSLFRSPARCMWTIRAWMDWHARDDWSDPAPQARGANLAAEALAARTHSGALTESEAKEIVARYGITVPVERIVGTAADAASVADDLGYPLVVKVVSPDILHKSEVGGVRVGLRSAEAVREAVETMSARLAQEAPGARIEGFSVQQMAGEGPEVLLGARFDAVFGPLVLLGSGGTWVEILKDAKVYLPLTERADALAAIEEMTLAKVLAGARGEAAYDTDALADAIVGFSRLVTDLDGLAADTELNPVRITRERGPVAVDALIVPADGVHERALAAAGAR